MINKNDENVLIEAQKMFVLNNGMPPIIFMAIKDKPDLVIENLDMDTYESTIMCIEKIKIMIESEELREFILILDNEDPKGDWVLIVIKASAKQELQFICNINYEDGEYKFSKWTYHDGTNLKATKNSFNNLFGQVYCKYN